MRPRPLSEEEERTPGALVSYFPPRPILDALMLAGRAGHPAAPGEIIGHMPAITVTRPAGCAFHVGDPYRFALEGEYFDGVVRDICPVDTRRVELTLEMRTEEYRRALAALDS